VTESVLIIDAGLLSYDITIWIGATGGLLDMFMFTLCDTWLDTLLAHCAIDINSSNSWRCSWLLWLDMDGPWEHLEGGRRAGYMGWMIFSS
jgi:hypothetical protein